MPRTIKIEIGLDTKQADAQLLGFQRRFKSAIDPSITSVQNLRSALSAATVVFGGLTAAGLGAVAVLKQFSDLAIQSAVNVNKQVNALKALTGSAEAAQRRFQELFRLAQQTPGLTTSLATTLDAQLRVFDVAERTINRLLPVIGRLNAISPLGDPRQFVNNLTQLITQNFERQDLKELVGQSPIAGQLIKQIFNVDNPTNAEAIRAAAKRLGVTTVERLAEELIEAAGKNSALRNATETLAGQFEKLQERITIALAPIGQELLKVISPAFQELVKIIERDAPKITELLRNNKDEFLAVASAVVATASAVGRLIGEFNKLDQKLGIIRALSLLAVLVTSPTAAFAVNEVFDRTETLGRLNAGQRLQFATSRGDLRALPSTEELRAFALSTADLSLLATLPPAPGGAGAGRGGGGFPGDGDIDSSAARAARKRAQEIAEIQKKILEGQDEFSKAVIKDLEEIEKTLREGVIETERRSRERPAQLAGFSAANAERIRKIELETLRLEENTRRQATADLQRGARRDLQRSGRFIDAAVSRGQLAAGEAELLSQGANREFANQLREVLAIREQLGETTGAALDDLRDEIALFDQLGASINNTERFMRGFNSQVDSVGDAFERLGQNVSRALTNTRDLLGGLKQAVLGFFNDLLGQSLQNLLRNVFAPLAGIFGGAAGGGSSSGGGVGGFFRQAFGGGGGGGGFQQLATAFAGGGGGLSAPPSISSPLGGINFFSGGGATSAITSSGSFLNILNPFATGGSSAAGAAASASKFSFGSFAKGIGQSLGAAAPFLGLGIGSSLGGQSGLGQVLGGAGGALLGGTIAATVAPSLFSPFLAAFLASPIGVIIGAGLLVGGIFAGRAKQRRQDEETAGQLLGQAFQAVEQLATGIASDQIEGSQARAILESNIVGPFVQQINQLKTASVRRDWVKNQVPEIRGRFEANVVPLIAEQERRRADASRFSAIDRRLIPQFAGGGIVSGVDRGFDSVRALLRPGEMVLTQAQQAGIARLAGADAFSRAGVPGVQPQAAFQHGGIVSATSQQGGDIVIEELVVALDAESIAVRGMSGENGRRVVINHVRMTQLNRG